MDEQAQERIEGWLREVDRNLGTAESFLTSVMGALDDDGVAHRRALWVEARIKEAREDYVGLAVHVRSELERSVAEFTAPQPVLTGGAGI